MTWMLGLAIELSDERLFEELRLSICLRLLTSFEMREGLFMVLGRRAITLFIGISII